MTNNCEVCKETVVDGIDAQDKEYHIECFLCQTCLLPLNRNQFYTRDGELYCLTDYNLIFADRCAHCCELILGQSLVALDTKWHIEHFCCCICEKLLAKEPFIKKDGKPYCRDCNQNVKQEDAKRTNEVCDKCGEAILTSQDKTIHKGKSVHLSHFSCAYCQQPLSEKKGYKLINGQFFCTEDIGKEVLHVCFACRQNIVGLSVEAMGKFFHPHHFVCSKCEVPFPGSFFHEFQERPYCEQHYNEKVGTSCSRCGENASGNGTKAMIGLRNWCDKHFCCTGCDILLFSAKGIAQAEEWDGKPFCQKCLNNLPSDIRKKIMRYKEIEKKIKKL